MISHDRVFRKVKKPSDLDAAIVNLGDYASTPNLEDAVKGYIGISRVGSHEDLRIAQPFGPALFQQSRLEVAHCFLDVVQQHSSALRGEGNAVNRDEVGKRLDTIGKEPKESKQTLRCADVAMHAMRTQA